MREEIIKVLFYNKFWFQDNPDSKMPSHPDFRFFFAENNIHEVDAVVFHIPTLELVPEELKTLKRNKNQLWVYLCMECEAHYPEFQTHEIMSLFDLTVTYRTDADVPVPYICSFRNVNWRHPPAQKTAFINAFFSSRWDKSGRYHFLSEMISLLGIDSFGKIFNNIPREKDPYFKSGFNAESFNFKNDVIPKYKFTLAFENARAKDYVTEKFFQPLLLGSVPVYLGAPNVDDFTPGDHCYINVDSFSSVSELANCLTTLNNDDELYNEYFNWKKLPFKAGFESKLNLFSTSGAIDELISAIRKKLC